MRLQQLHQTFHVLSEDVSIPSSLRGESFTHAVWHFTIIGQHMLLHALAHREQLVIVRLANIKQKICTSHSE